MEDLQRQTLTEGETEYIINWKFSGTSVRSYNVSLVFLYKQSHLETMVVPMMVVWKLKHRAQFVKTLRVFVLIKSKYHCNIFSVCYLYGLHNFFDLKIIEECKLLCWKGNNIGHLLLTFFI